MDETEECGNDSRHNWIKKSPFLNTGFFSVSFNTSVSRIMNSSHAFYRHKPCVNIVWHCYRLSAIFLQKRPSASFRNFFLPYWGNLVYLHELPPIVVFHYLIQISMNAATAAMIATKMQLVQIPLDTSTADVCQDSQEMAASVMV